MSGTGTNINTLRKGKNRHYIFPKKSLERPVTWNVSFQFLCLTTKFCFIDIMSCDHMDSRHCVEFQYSNIVLTCLMQI